jgi:Macrocin-O-methyltransferase (TylF)
VEGLFADTLPRSFADNSGPVAFAHVDCDLYSSTATVLEHIGRLGRGSIVVFDEYFNYPGWQEHGHKAWSEFVARSGIGFSYEAYTSNHEQLVVRITEPVRSSLSAI